MISKLLSYLHQYMARKRLERAKRELDRIVRQTRDSYEIRRYRKKRAAALKGYARKRGIA